MSYVVLARKLRPKHFDDLVGQETIATILKNAILSDRVSHAFLFTGSRGTGKTTAARILTKAINCLNPQQGNPCDVCQNCKDITANASTDVFEIDAASNRGIDNIRELRENTKYAPANCQYKVYIIDEAHMLTLESFNALLKTLEEPPAHVKFILATTDPHKVPQTIISRCQRYDFVRIPRYKMVDYLEKVVANEKIQMSRRSLEMVAQHSVGGMRDSLTVIDQILSYTGEQASDEEVAQILGMVDSQMRFRLLNSILGKNPTESLDRFYEMQEHGHDFQDILSELLQSVKNLSLVHTLSQRKGTVPPTLFQDLPKEDVEHYQKLVASISLDELQQIFQILLELEERIKRSSHAQVCFEMALLQMTAVTPVVGIQDMIQQVRNLKQGLPAVPNQGAAPTQGLYRNQPPAVGMPQSNQAPQGRPQAPALQQNYQAPQTNQVPQTNQATAAQQVPPVTQQPNPVSSVQQTAPNPSQSAISSAPQQTLRTSVPAQPEQNSQAAVAQQKNPINSEQQQPPTTRLATPNPSQQNQQIPVPQQNQQTQIPQQNQQIPVPQQNQHIPVPQHNQQIPVPQQNQHIPVPQQNQQAPVAQQNQQIPVPQQNQQNPVPQQNQQTPVPQQNQQTPVPQQNQQIPVPQQNQQIPASQQNQQIPVPQQSNSIPPQEATTAQQPPPRSQGQVAKPPGVAPVIAQPTKASEPLAEEDMSLVLPSKEWEAFVLYVQEQSPRMGSMLRNAVLSEKNDQSLRIAFKDPLFISMVTSEQVSQISQWASEFFKSSIAVEVDSEKTTAATLTVSEKENRLLADELARRKQAVRDHEQTKLILNSFPGSEIVKIHVPEPKL